MTRIDTVASRSKLKPRRPPYWQRMERGVSLGFRRMSTDAPGTWLVAIRDADSGKETRKSLGDFSHLTEAERFDAAKKAADALASHIDKGGTVNSMTVGKLCAAYIKHRRDEGAGRSMDDAEKFVKKWIDTQPIGRIDVRKLTAHHLRAWRLNLATTDVVANIHAPKEKQIRRKRTPSTLNRQQTILRAALNHALDGGIVSSDMAWRVSLKPIPNADKRRDVYLDKQQRAALLAHADTAFAPLLQCMMLLPLRPGAAAALTAGDFNTKLGTLQICTDKANAGRTIKLPPSHISFFKEVTKDKLPGAPMFTRADGKPWTKDDWKWVVKDAAQAAKLPATTVLYTLRHAAITDLVVAGADPLTVSRISGTSLVMIQRTYGHLTAAAAESALSALAM